MPSLRVFLVNCSVNEIRQMEDLLSQYDPEISSMKFPTLAEAEPHLREGSVVLVALRVDDTRKRPDQDIHRIRRSLARPVPVLLLITAEHVGKVREYLHAGADEYWILPLDAEAFPPRLQVLLEWGMSVSSGEKDAATRHALKGAPFRIPLLDRLWSSIQGWLARGAGKQSATSSIIAGKWEKIKRIGFGSYGEVWLVVGIEDSHQAVAKIPHNEKLNTKFLREAAILKRLTGHPNAVQLKEVVKEDKKVILIQEFVEGATLQDLLGQQMDAVTKEKAFLQLLDVVACAHKQNIMHRDIKPENIIITHSGTLKLLDFGTGKDLTRRSISSTVIGSRPFMAPEQIMGSSRLASDVWALGVILYALATTCLPFYDDNEKQLMDLILEADPEKPRNLEPDLPEPLETIILNCLQKDWTKRYRDAQTLRDVIIASFPNFGSGAVLPGT